MTFAFSPVYMYLQVVFMDLKTRDMYGDWDHVNPTEICCVVPVKIEIHVAYGKRS